MKKRLKFFFARRKLLILYVLRDHICEDNILQIIEYSIKNDKLLNSFNTLNQEIENCEYISSLFPKNNTITRPLPCLLLLFSNSINHNSYREIYFHYDIFRTLYLKEKLSKKQNGHYSKCYNTWIKFQYYLIKTKSSFEECKVYGFQGIKQLSDVLYA